MSFIIETALFHLDTASSSQNQSRVFKESWQNFDDPQAFLSFVSKLSQLEPSHHKRLGKVLLLSDVPLDVYPVIEADHKLSLALINSRIEGRIELNVEEHKTHIDTQDSILFYNVHLSKDDLLKVTPGHIVVTTDRGITYSMQKGPFSKAELREQQVYRLEKGEFKPFVLFKDFESILV